MATRVFVDANVLFSRTQRDWLYHLRQETGGGMFTVLTSEDVLAETIYRYRRKNPRLSGGHVSRLRTALETLQDEMVSQYTIADDVPLDDQDDLHVHAAAVESGAAILLTNDTGWSKLTADERDRLPYDTYSPDEFFTLTDDSEPAAVARAVGRQLAYWARRNPDNVDLVSALERAQCHEFAQRVTHHLRMRALLPDT